MRAMLERPFLGSGLSAGGAAVTMAVAPAVWALFALAMAAMPS